MILLNIVHVLLHVNYFVTIPVLTYRHIFANIASMEQFTITQDNETKQVTLAPKAPEYENSLRLQAEMFAYDLLHGTSYRQVRNRLMREQRNRQFEQRLGLVRK